MNWNQLLDKISDFKELCDSSQLKLNAASLATMLYCGCFDEMIDLPKPIQWHQYGKLFEELKLALGSKALLPKAKKTEALGLADVDSDLKLNLWRYQANPTYNFSLAEHFYGFMQAEGFVKSFSTDRKMIFHKPAPEDQRCEPRYRVKKIEVWNSWKYLFENQVVYKRNTIWVDAKGNNQYPQVTLGLLGMIQDLQPRPLKNGKESYTFKLFLGGEVTDDIRVWSAKGQDFVPHAIRQHLKNGNVGVALLRISKYNDKPSGSLEDWRPAGKWQST